MLDNVIEVIKPAAGSGNELKPCPFCGSEDIAFVQYEHAAGLRYKVCCFSCLAEIDPGYAQKPHVVADMWNRRATHE